MKRAAKLCLLGTFFAICGSAALFQAAWERRLRFTPPVELYSVVSKQLAAFRADDFTTAYRQVSMSFQERFNIATFSDFARAEYPGLMRATRVEFGAVRFEGRRATVPVYFFLPEGETIPCLYLLVREEDAWKIETVRVLKRWPPSRRLGGARA